MATGERVCGLDVALAVMGGKWKPLILYHLHSGPRRFGDLRRRVAGISEKVLIQHLCEWGNAHRVQVERIMLARSSEGEARAD